MKGYQQPNNNNLGSPSFIQSIRKGQKGINNLTGIILLYLSASFVSYDLWNINRSYCVGLLGKLFQQG